jgi:uncharacterized protein (DUF2132 family)
MFGSAMAFFVKTQIAKKKKEILWYFYAISPVNKSKCSSSTLLPQMNAVKKFLKQRITTLEIVENHMLKKGQ